VPLLKIGLSLILNYHAKLSLSKTMVGGLEQLYQNNEKMWLKL